MRVWIGIDNGVTGSIAIVNSDKECLGWYKTPTMQTRGPWKNGKYINRIDRKELSAILQQFVDHNTMVLMEKPMISPEPARIHSTFSAAMSFADTWAIIEDLNLAHDFLSSGDWQKVLIPDSSGTYALKKASRDMAKRLYPKVAIPASADGDGILIAEFGRRTNR